MNSAQQHIFDSLSQKIAQARNPIIVCGHFKLLPNTSRSSYYPGIYQDLVGIPNLGCWTVQALALDPYAGNTPTETFDMGARLVSAHTHARILILVKDWFSHNHVRQDNSENPAIMEWYQKNELPKSFGGILETHKLSPECILSPPADLTYEDNALFFSENALRNAFDHTVEFQSCSLGKICAQDQIPEYDYLVNIGCDLIINFLPAGCGEALYEARLFSQERYPDLTIENFRCYGDVAESLFWEKVGH